MPVVTVTAPWHPGIPALLSAVADAVAEALQLGVGDVIATAIPSGPSVSNGSATVEAGWTIVTVHGSDRGADAATAACGAASRAVTEWSEQHLVPTGGVWTEWITPGMAAR